MRQPLVRGQGGGEPPLLLREPLTSEGKVKANKKNFGDKEKPDRTATRERDCRKR